MPEDFNIILILGIGLSFACIAGYVAQRLKLSPILGYLIAGFLIGPNSPGYIADNAISDQLSKVGVTLLMFAVGLNFDWKDINAVKKLVIPGGISLSLLSIAAGMILGDYLGERLIEGFVIGVAICVSSTVVIVRVLTDQELLHTKQGHIVIGWTIVEDMVSVFALILLPALVLSSVVANTSPALSITYSIGIALVKILILGLIVYLFGEKIIDSTLKMVARTRSQELFTLAILAFVFLIAIGSSYYFGISLALGAFIAGTVIGKTELSHQAAANSIPMRDAFAVLFFLSVGMLFDPFSVLHNIPLFVGILFIIMFLRPLIAFMIIKIAKYPSYIGFSVALAISQIGEYSFILAEEGSRLKILPDNSYDILIVCAFISIALNPLLFKWFKPLLVPKQYSPTDADSGGYSLNMVDSDLPKALVVGYGPVGRAVAYYLSDKYQVVVIDQNIDTVSSSRSKNIEMLFGDAAQLHLLERAKIEKARLVVVTTPDFRTTNLIIESIEYINPNVRIISRLHFKTDSDQMKFRDIPTVCDEEAAAEKMISLIKAGVG